MARPPSKSLSLPSKKVASTLAGRVRFAFEAAGLLTVADVLEALKGAGLKVSHSRYANWVHEESGVQSLPVEALTALWRATGVSPWWIASGLGPVYLDEGNDGVLPDEAALLHAWRGLGKKERAALMAAMRELTRR